MAKSVCHVNTVHGGRSLDYPQTGNRTPLHSICFLSRFGFPDISIKTVGAWKPFILVGALIGSHYFEYCRVETGFSLVEAILQLEMHFCLTTFISCRGLDFQSWVSRLLFVEFGFAVVISKGAQIWSYHSQYWRVETAFVSCRGLYFQT